MDDLLCIKQLYVNDNDSLRNRLCNRLLALNYEVTAYAEYSMPDVLKIVNPRKNAYHSVDIIFDKNYACADVNEVIFNIELTIGLASTIKHIYVNAPFSSRMCDAVCNILKEFNIPYTFSHRSDERDGSLEILQSDISCRFGKFEILSKEIHFFTSPKPFNSSLNTLFMGYGYNDIKYGEYAEMSISALIAAIIFGRLFEKYDDLETTAKDFLIYMNPSFENAIKAEVVKESIYEYTRMSRKYIFSDEDIYALQYQAWIRNNFKNKNKKGPDFLDKNLNIGTRDKKVVGIKYVGYKGNKTTVVFDDDSTVTVRCRDGEQFDLYHAITYAFMERNLGLSKNKTHKLIQNLIDDADARKLKKLNAMSKKMKGAKSNEKTEKSNDEG